MPIWENEIKKGTDLDDIIEYKWRTFIYDGLAGEDTILYEKLYD